MWGGLVMAESHFCDVCGEIIKREVYVLAVTKHFYPSTEEERMLTPQEYIEKSYQDIKNQRKNTVVKEVCPKCNELLGFLFEIRLRKIREIRKEIKIFKQLFHEEGGE